MPGEGKSYYTLLGILRDASPEDIRRAYYEAAQRLHPDKNKLAGETEIFLEVQKAYEVLSNPQRRAQYDATLPRESTTVHPIDHKILYSRPNLVHLTEPQLVYALLEVGPQRNEKKTPAPPLNICLVLDRSTSMQGEKLDLAKAAAAEIIRHLRAEDIFSMVVFSDRAEVIVPAAYQSDRTRLQSRIQGIQAGGGTEIFAGLSAGITEIRRSLDDNRINHLVLLTDGHTYGDEPKCVGLAEEASKQKIGISTFGIGGDWNDIFLDTLASTTGNNSMYISKPQQIQRLLIEKFDALTNTYADDTLFETKQAEGVLLSYAFRLQPDTGPIGLHETMHLGPILQDTRLSVLFEFVIQPSASQEDVITLLDGILKVTVTGHPNPLAPLRIKFDRKVADTAQDDPPPVAILDALSRFSLYRLQERARQEADLQDYESATRHLKNLAALLLTQGEKDLAKTALLEAEQTQKMQALSNEGGKEIKYGTRALFASTAGNSE